jgi:hypothetical protein
MNYKLKHSLAIFALALLPSLGIFAQEVKIQDFSYRSFSGVKPLNNYQGYYLSYFGEKTENKGMANYIIEVYDANLKQAAKTTVEVTKYSEVVASAFDGTYFLFAFRDQMKRTLTYVTLDKTGKQVGQRVVEKVKVSLDNPTVLSIGNGEFLVLQPVKENKVGYQLEKIDQTFASKYTKTYTPDKRKWYLIDAEFKNNKLYIIRKNANWGDQFEEEVVCYDTQSGEEVYAHSLYDGNNSGLPSFLQVTDQGEVATGGMYFKGNEFDDKNSDGIFSVVLDAQGKVKGQQQTPWKVIQDKIKSDMALGALISGKSKVFIHDMVMNNDGSFSIIGENFRKSSAAMSGNFAMKMAMGGGAGDGIGFTIEDFVIFNFDTKGTLTTIDRIEKTAKEIVVKQTSTEKVAYKGLELALKLNAADQFPYQYVVEHNQKPHLVYINNEGLRDKAYFLPLGSKTSKDIPSIDLQYEYFAVSDGLSKTMAGLQKLTGNQQTVYLDSWGHVEDNQSLLRGVLPAGNGKMLIYKYDYTPDSKGLKLWIESIPSSNLGQK